MNALREFAEICVDCLRLFAKRLAVVGFLFLILWGLSAICKAIGGG